MATRDEIRALADSATAAGTRALPPIPFTPPPPDLVKRIPAIARWYEEVHRALERWRQQADRAIRGPGA